jgi:hypothetical protein
LFPKFCSETGASHGHKNIGALHFYPQVLELAVALISRVGDKAASAVRLMERAALPSAGPLTRNKERFPHQRVKRFSSYLGRVMT